MNYQKLPAFLRAMLLCASLGLVSAEAAETAEQVITLTGRVELFNGKDFAGWTFFMRSNAAPEKTWTVTNGVIHCAGRPPGYLRTEKSFRDYKVTVEWRFVKVAPRAENTGVLVHMQLPEKIWPKCVECQGQHDKQGEFWMQGGATCRNHETAETRHVTTSEPSNEKPVGEWNVFEAECAGSNVKVSINGKLMNEALECNVSSGFIGIQSEGAEIEVRKVYLEPLK